MRANLSYELTSALKELKKREANQGQSVPRILHGADVRFTLDNGDTHDVAFHLKPTQCSDGSWNADVRIVDSIPRKYQDEHRPLQHEAYESLGNVVASFFKHVGISDPVKSNVKIHYSNAQLGGYCTTHALFALGDDIPGPATDQKSNDIFFRNFIAKCQQAKSLPEKIPYVKEILSLFDGENPLGRISLTGEEIFSSYMDRLIDAAKMDWRNVTLGYTSDRYGTHHKGNEKWYELTNDRDGNPHEITAYQNLLNSDYHSDDSNKSYERIKVEQSKNVLDKLLRCRLKSRSSITLICVLRSRVRV